MKEYLPLLRSIELFSGMDTVELESMLGCIGARVAPIRKGVVVLLAGETPLYVGVILTGQLHVIRESYNGDRALIAVLSAGDIFAEALCCAGVTSSPVTVVSDTDSEIALLSFDRILKTCANSCSSHRKLIGNMLGLIAEKNLRLQSHMEILELRSIRAKVTHYLQSLATGHKREVVIPFNREELADYLCVERSALSHELMRMKRDGLIEYNRNRFVLVTKR